MGLRKAKIISHRNINLGAYVKYYEVYNNHI